MTKFRYWGLLGLSAVFASMVLFMLLVIEYGAPLYVPLWVYAVILLPCYGMLFGLSSGHRGFAKYVVPVLFTVGGALSFFTAVADNSLQSFMRNLYHVKPGMNIVQVEAIMGRYNRYNKMFGIQNTKRLPSGQLVLLNAGYAVYKHSTPDDGDFNAACGAVHFKNGKATSVEYIGD